MSQSKKKSFLESVVNTFVGMIVTMIFSPVIYWLCNVEISWPQMSYAMILFTILSIARNYIIRRIFNRKEPNIVTISELPASIIQTEYLTLDEIIEKYPNLSDKEIQKLKELTK